MSSNSIAYCNCKICNCNKLCRTELEYMPMPTNFLICKHTNQWRIQGLQWLQLKPPQKCARRIQLTSGRARDTFIATVQVKRFRRLLNTDKPIFWFRKATKVTSNFFLHTQTQISYTNKSIISEADPRRQPTHFSSTRD